MIPEALLREAVDVMDEVDGKWTTPEHIVAVTVQDDAGNQVVLRRDSEAAWYTEDFCK